MNLGEILRIMGRRSLLILGCALVGVLLAAATQVEIGSGGFVPKAGRYRASTRLFLDMPRADAATATSAAVRTMLMTHTHAEVVMTQSMARDISKRIGGAYDEFEVMDALHAFSIIPTPIVVIQMDGDSPEDATALTEAAAAAYQNWLAESQDNAGTPEQARLVATQIDEPRLDDVESLTREVTRWMIFGGVIGVTIGIVIAFGLPLPEPRPSRRRPTPETGSYPVPSDPSISRPVARSSSA